LFGLETCNRDDPNGGGASSGRREQISKKLSICGRQGRESQTDTRIRVPGTAFRHSPPPLLDSASVTDEKETAEAERVLGASASSASATGGGELDEDPSSATKTRRSKGHWVFILVVVVVVLADAALLSAKFLFTHPQASPNGLPPGVSLAAFEARIEQQVRSRAKEGFGVASARSTRCFMGSAWAKGQQFSCFVYDSRGTYLGEVSGTVGANRGKKFSWYSLWTPNSKSGTRTTSPTTSHS
jgi:hypothetical protein